MGRISSAQEEEWEGVNTNKTGKLYKIKKQNENNGCKRQTAPRTFLLNVAWFQLQSHKNKKGKVSISDKPNNEMQSEPLPL